MIDIQQPSIETLKAATDRIIGELASVHFQKMACSCECVADPREIRGGSRSGERWDAVRLRCVVPSPVELALQIGLSDLQVAKGHADVFVTHQLLEGRQANSATEHVRGPGMAQAVRRDRARVGTACSLGKIGQRQTQSLKQGEPAAHARQQEALGFCQTPGGELGTDLKDTVDQPKPSGIEGHKAFGMHLSERHMQRPLFGSNVTQTVQRQVYAFPNADAGKAHQQQGIGVQVVCTAQFLLQPSIIFRGQGSGEILGTYREVFAEDETRLDTMALGGQVIESASKAEQTLLPSMVADRRTQLAKPPEPTQHVGIATEL